MKNRLYLFILLPLGFIKKLSDLTKSGTRDITNKIRFKGAKIDSSCSIDSKTVIHSNAHILGNSIINNCSISSYSYIGRNCLVQNTKIGKFCSIANDVFIGLGTHPTDYFSTSPLLYRKKNTFGLSLVDEDKAFDEYREIEIENDVWIGARAIILDGVKIGNGAIVASNSVVTKDVPPYAIVGGVPAKVLKFRFDVEKIDELNAMQWWNWDLNTIKDKMINENSAKA
ncbi:DapH/DapD/GlmU-related protein [Saccharicrinis sp. FJH62]|uniref:DapH/DapD/GlmU-related protein n=1 Tax=Saccharicrinis sp. FJH62 TaxID=3344657 RepID=UPI0035D49350